MLAFFRFLAGLALLIAVIAAVYDGTRSLAADRAVTTPLLEHWAYLAPGSLASAKAAVARTAGPLVWEMGIARVLALPAWAVLGCLGLILAYAGRRRRRVNVFAN